MVFTSYNRAIEYRHKIRVCLKRSNFVQHTTETQHVKSQNSFFFSSKAKTANFHFNFANNHGLARKTPGWALISHPSKKGFRTLLAFSGASGTEFTLVRHFSSGKTVEKACKTPTFDPFFRPRLRIANLKMVKTPVKTVRITEITLQKQAYTISHNFDAARRLENRFSLEARKKFANFCLYRLKITRWPPSKRTSLGSGCAAGALRRAKPAVDLHPKSKCKVSKREKSKF